MASNPIPEIPGSFPECSDEAVPAFPEVGVGMEERALFLDVAAFLAGGLPEAPAPTVARRSDGCGLFYEQSVNMLFGEPEGGKTLLGQFAVVEVLAADGRAAVLDMDHNGPSATLDRLARMGADLTVLSDPRRFRYVEPEDQWHLAAVVAALKEWKATAILVDSIGELLPLLNLSSNSPDDFTLAHARVLKPLAMSGAAVIAIDHLAKSAESKAAGPTGTAAKKRAVSGSSLRVTATRSFTPGHGGAAALTINKDRHGGLRRRGPAPDGKGEVFAGTFVIIEDGDQMRCRVKAPSDGESFSVVSPNVAALAKLDPPPTSVDDVKTRMRWGSDKATAALREFREAFPVPTSMSGIPGTLSDGVCCTVCKEPLNPAIADEGATTHPTCGARS